MSQHARENPDTWQDSLGERALEANAERPLRSEAEMYLGETRPTPGGSSARARLESVTRIRGLVETAHNYLGRTPSPPHEAWNLARFGAVEPAFTVDEPTPDTRPIKDQALDAFETLERILVQWQGFEQDKLK